MNLANIETILRIILIALKIAIFVNIFNQKSIKKTAQIIAKMSGSK